MTTAGRMTSSASSPLGQTTPAAAVGVPAWLDRAAYPFTSRWFRQPEGQMHYIDEGTGEVLVFAHGTPTWSFEFRHLIAALAPRYRCVAPDHLGFGLSDRPADADYTPQAHAARFRALVDGLGLERFTLVVHDFGGPIALPLALDQPERITGLVLLNTWMWSFVDDPDMRKKARLAGSGLGKLLYKYGNASLRLIAPSAYGDRRKLTRAIHRQYLAVFPTPESRGRVLWALARALLGASDHFDGLWQRRDRLRGIPSKIIWGDKDSAFRLDQLQKWRQALPEAAVATITGAGHWPHEEEPERVLAEMRSFLSRAAAP